MTLPSRDAIVAAWCRSDSACAILPGDREIIRDSAAIRELIVDLAIEAPGDELYDACAVMGRFIAERQGSPTLASMIMDHAWAALGGEGTWLEAARAALSEAFAAAIVEAARLDAMQMWEFPHCAVFLGDASIAVAAAHPSDDDEVLTAWAARLARAAAIQGVRRAVLAGPDRPRGAVAEALTVVGIELASLSAPPWA